MVLESKPSATAQPDPPKFIGWQRRERGNGRGPGRWEPVASGDTDAEVSAKLLDMGKGQSGNRSIIVLPAGQEP